MYLSMSIASAEPVAEHRDSGGPDRGAGDVGDEEPVVLHLARAREHRHDGADEGDEAREHDGTRAALTEERVRPIEVLRLEDARVGLEEPDAPAVADPVADLRAGHRGGERPDDDHRQVEVRVARSGVGRAEGAGEEEDGVAGQRRRDDARFHEHDQQQTDRSEGLDQVVRAEPVDREHSGER